jgi:hypothetical protein
MRGLRLGLNFQAGKGTPDPFAEAPIIALVADDLELDPPAYSFTSDQDGTLRWDFHSGGTAPASGAGDIATGTDTADIGVNNFTIDLSAYLEETGFLYFRVSNVNGTSNVLKSQEITVPGLVVTDRFGSVVNDRAGSPISVRSA